MKMKKNKAQANKTGFNSLISIVIFVEKCLKYDAKKTVTTLW